MFFVYFFFGAPRFRVNAYTGQHTLTYKMFPPSQHASPTMVLLITYGMRLGSALQFLTIYQYQITLLLLGQAALTELAWSLTAMTAPTYTTLVRLLIAIGTARTVTLLVTSMPDTYEWLFLSYLKHIRGEVVISNEQVYCYLFALSALEADFCVDSGCSRTLINDVNHFSSFNPDADKVRIYGFNGASVFSEGVGTAKFLVQDKEGKDTELLVPNCLYVPKIKHELLSTSQLNLAGHDVLLSNNNSCIVHKNGSVIPLKTSSGLYYIPPILDRCSADEDTTYSIIGRTWKLLRSKLGAASSALAENSTEGLERDSDHDPSSKISARSNGKADGELDSQNPPKIQNPPQEENKKPPPMEEAPSRALSLFAGCSSPGLHSEADPLSFEVDVPERISVGLGKATAYLSELYGLDGPTPMALTANGSVPKRKSGPLIPWSRPSLRRWRRA